MKRNELVVQVSHYANDDVDNVISKFGCSSNIKFSIPVTRSIHRRFQLSENQQKHIDAVFQRIRDVLDEPFNE